MRGQVTVLWEGVWQEVDVLEEFRAGEFVARLQSGEEIVIPTPQPEISSEMRAASLSLASEVFYLEFLLAGDENILQAPLPLN